MKQILYMLALLCIFTGSHAQSSTPSSNQNYIRTRTYLYQTGTEFRDEVTYFDGVGRPVQTVQTAITPAKKDLAFLQEYDAAGRPSLNWLPAMMTTSNGVYTTPATIQANARTSNAGDSYPYAVTNYEKSPLQRATSAYGPGAGWHTGRKAMQTGYLTNKAKSGTAITFADSLVCKLYASTHSPASVSISCSANYAADQLNVTRMVDEEGNKAYEFRDKQGQVVLTRQLNASELIDTYYVYDSFGNLRAVLPPLATTALASGTWTDTNATLAQYAYLYKYDSRNRLIAKKLPGADWTYYVYDKADRVIFSQDGEQRKSSEWAFTIPDALGRPVISGISKNALTYTANPLGTVVVKAIFSPVNNEYKGYAISGVNLTTPTVLSVNYYDGYTFMGYNGVPGSTDAHFKAETMSGYGTQYTGGYSGLLTGTLTARLTGKTVEGYLHKVLYYDTHQQVIQIKSSNHLTGGIDKEYLAYNFVGQPTARKLVHTANGATQTEEYKYTYDHAGRLTKATHQLGTAALTTLVDNTYDEQGRLATSRKGGNESLKTTMTYNVRSWPTRIASTHFWENLTYGWNGNITKQEWGQSGKTRSYTFAYDNLSRLRTATYAGDGAFGSSYTYDKNGNIKTLTRSGQTAATTYGVIDNLTLEYTGNQLKYVTDSGPNVTYNGSQDFKDYTKGTGTEYTFDQNGRMTKDLNKGIGVIQYNWLHLPSQVDLKNQAAEMRKTYTYAADGTRLTVDTKWNPSPSASASPGAAVAASALTATKKTDYVAGKVYENGTLKKILIDGGYYDMTDKKYYFFVTDHLGSTRIVGNTAGAIAQTNQYDPFGVQFAEQTTTAQDKQPYKYTAQELDRDQGLNLYDYHARQYDPAIGRFTTMDPLAEKYYSISPYAYCANNPVKFVDPKGESIWDFIGGVVHAIGSNLTLGTAPANTDFVSNPSHYNSGRSVGDMVSIAIGAAEISIGGGMISGASLATAGSGGAALPVAVPVAIEGGAVIVHGGGVVITAATSLKKNEGRISESNNSQNSVGARRKNWIPDSSKPNTVKTNPSGTTKKKYGPDGNVQKEFNKGHAKDKNKYGKDDHIHDYKPNPHNPSGLGERQPPRKIKKGELNKDFK